MKKYCFKIIAGLIIAIAVTAIFFWQFSLWQNPISSISCGGDWSYNVRCPFGTYCRPIGQGPLTGGFCTPFLFFFKSSIDSKPVYPTPVAPTSPTIKTAASPAPTKNQQGKTTTKDPDNLFLRQTNITSGYDEGVVFEFGPKKKVKATIQTTDYGQDFGYTQLYELVSVQPADPRKENLFASSRIINLKNYLGKRVTIYYREVIGLIMGEEQFVLVDKVE